MLRALLTNIGELNAIGTVVTAVATIALTTVSGFLWLETRRLRELHHAADIVVTAEAHPRYPRVFDLVIENVGEGIAREVRLTLEKPVSVRTLGKDRELHALPLFARTIPVLKRGQSIRYFLCEYYEACPSFAVQASWRAENGRRMQRQSVIDIAYFGSSVIFHKDPLNDIALAQKHIAASMHVIAKGAAPATPA